jgi:O-methyltransferase involved in polyketide biosynthesis
VALLVQYSWPEFVGADLSKVSLAEALKPTSFDPKQRTLFMTEGLVYYLPPAAFQQQLESISTNAAMGSRLFFDFLHLSTLSGENWHPGFETLMVVSAGWAGVVLAAS